nr:hypothetical protein [Tanacetum cinerariifolium]
MAERAHNEKLKDVRNKLSYSESSKRDTEYTSQHHNPQGSKRKNKKRGEKRKEAHRATSMSRSKSVFSRLRLKTRGTKERRVRSLSQASSHFGSVLTHLGANRKEQRRRDTRELMRSYVTCSSERQRENKREYYRHEWETSFERRNNEPSKTSGVEEPQEEQIMTYSNLIIRNPSLSSPDISMSLFFV